jgi:hypothetical protein
MTAGCCDRNFWHYRLSDIANARFQEIGLLVALAYVTEAPANPFSGRHRLAELAHWIWRFWLSRRNRDGSSVEVYPNERSFCATSFSASSFVHTVGLLGGAKVWSDELADARSTMTWLDANLEADAANQVAASWLALDGYARLTGDPAIVQSAERRRRVFLDAQWPDGTLPEYGGLDVGYQTISMSAMASLLALNPGDDELAAALRTAESLIAPRIAADGAVDAGANSRDTQFLYPHALAVLKSPALEGVLTGLDARTVLRPTWMDDRYCHALAADYFLAYRILAHVDDDAAASAT